MDGVKHTYTMDGTKILRETWGANTLILLYDNEDSVCGILYNNVPYYFLKNLQGDVIAVTDKNGEVVAKYSYDAWGVCTIAEDTTACGIATVNPFRYRSYYYDVEIGLYYLQSRYYDPEVGRFLNADNVLNIGIEQSKIIFHLFVYIGNDPINNTDFAGMFSWSIFGKIIQNIVGFSNELLSFVLRTFGMSRKAYAKRYRYQKPNQLVSYVNGNKQRIKNLKSSISDIAFMIDIILTVADCISILRQNRNAVVTIADFLFYGVIRLLSYLGNKLISWIISKVCAVLFWARFAIEYILNAVWNWVLGSRWIDRLRAKFLMYIDASCMTLSGYITTLFKSAKACFA